VACGWGGTYDGSPLPDYMQCVDLQIIHNSECVQYYGSGTVGDNIVCVAWSTARAPAAETPVVPWSPTMALSSWESPTGCRVPAARLVIPLASSA